MASLTVRFGDELDNPIRANTAVHVEVSGADNWSPDPTEDDPNHTVENVYYLLMDGPGTDDQQSYRFSTNVDGEHTYDDFIFPQAGSYTVKLMKVGENSDSQVTTTSVTVDE